MNKITVELAQERTVQCEAWEVTPGLCVHRDTEDRELWVVTHIRSGAAITETDSPEHATMLAHQAATLVDWDQAGAAIKEALGRFGDALYEDGLGLPRPAAMGSVGAERLSL